MRRGRRQEENLVKATYAYYANGCSGSFDYYTEEECKQNVEVAAIKLELARYVTRIILNVHFFRTLILRVVIEINFNFSFTFLYDRFPLRLEAARQKGTGGNPTNPSDFEPGPLQSLTLTGNILLENMLHR